MKKQIIIFAALLCLTATIADNPLSLEIPQGKSNFTIQEYFPSIYVSELVRQNPEIQSITIHEYGQTFGYLNTLGGIGTNFLVEPNRNYEIHANETISITIK